MPTQQATKNISPSLAPTTLNRNSHIRLLYGQPASGSPLEPIETFVNKVQLNGFCNGAGSENSSEDITQALQQMNISHGNMSYLSGSSIGPGVKNLAPNASQNRPIELHSAPTSNSNLGSSVKDQLDGYALGYSNHPTRPWPPGIYTAIPRACIEGLEEHEFLTAQTIIIERRKFLTKVHSLKKFQKSLIELHSIVVSRMEDRGGENRPKQSQKYKRSLRAHRLRLERLALSAKRISDTVTEIYGQRQEHFFMNSHEGMIANKAEMRAWKIKVTARRVRWFKHRAPAEYTKLASNLKDILLLEIAKNKEICRQLRERYQSVVWGQKGWKADEGLVNGGVERQEWDSEASDGSDETDDDNESEDTEDESEEDSDDWSPETSNSHSSTWGSQSSRRSSMSWSPRRSSQSSGRKSGSSRKKYPYIKLVFKHGSED
ncbi:hypothetical protein HOY82DRAFT_540166 [Tuber indicum]|nr:hypothetical protein HOY82DRAFT_540166 [Tuber indicum]